MKKEVGIATIFILIIASFSGCIVENENEIPGILIAYPHEGDIISGILNISGSAYDRDGNVERIEVSIAQSNEEYMIWKQANGTSEWHYIWDTPHDDNGIYRISARSFDGKDYSIIFSVNVTVNNTMSNHPPVAGFTYTADGLTVSFTDMSSDIDGDSLEYFWDFGDQSDGQDTTMQNPVHTYPTPGTYTVTLTVDDGRATDEKSTNITVSATLSNFTIASWNLQIFGVTKASNETLLDYYADKIDNYDICIVQEIRDKSGTAIQELAAKLPEYHYIISERAGTTSSKEQYAIFYDGRAVLINYHDYTPEKQNEFERPPLEATFTVSNWTFTLYTIHTKPSNVPNELTNLENLTGEPSTDTLILGDLNADGSYYDENDREQFINWDWVITNDMDTTVASSDNTYDRIIINNAVENNLISVGIMKDVTKDESDHYLIYAVFDSGAI
ncbi:MAG: PKD domain-containing protein [Thermoplasmata archaeon]|nr:PKD domain-containing protein [Thermoplasmata archaeon]